MMLTVEDGEKVWLFHSQTEEVLTIAVEKGKYIVEKS